jgi:hypothetical protein
MGRGVCLQTYRTCRDLHHAFSRKIGWSTHGEYWRKDAATRTVLTNEEVA